MLEESLGANLHGGLVDRIDDAGPTHLLRFQQPPPAHSLNKTNKTNKTRNAKRETEHRTCGHAALGSLGNCTNGAEFARNWRRAGTATWALWGLPGSAPVRMPIRQQGKSPAIISTFT
jgi:hypothetical protein